MKLNLNAKEFLALYNNLYEHVTVAANTDPQLKELFNRVKACIVTSLSAKDEPPLEELYFMGQREKIDQLKQKNEEISRSVTILTDDANDPVVATEYPRKVSIAKLHKKKG